MVDRKVTAPPAPPEASGVNVRAVIVTGLGLSAIVVLCAIALLGFRAWLARGLAYHAGPSTEAIELQGFAAPRLETDPARDIAAFDREKAAKLHRYRWIDRSRGLVQIPIERAMELQSQAHAQRSDHER
jgi:hypothetical protein